MPHDAPKITILQSSVAGKGKGKGKLGMVLPYTDPTFSATDLALVSPLTRPFYHDCDDYDLCRRLMVDQNIGIDELKRKVLDAGLASC